MPSPFPGMDPYLEGPLWTTVHTALSVAIAQQLSPLIDPKYVALPNERYVLSIVNAFSEDEKSTSIYPDASVARATNVHPPTSAPTAMIESPLLLEMIVPDVEPQLTVEIRDVANRRLVTAIEVLSPTNKQSPGYEDYMEKRARLLRAGVHLMEIDLLRSGKRVPMRKPLPDAPYFVLLSRAHAMPFAQVWPIAFGSALPEVPVPLLPGDPDVRLNLQTAFSAVYDSLNYRRIVDYRRPPANPLPPELAEWAKELTSRTA